MDPAKNVLHVFTVPFSITYFVGEQFSYLHTLSGNRYFVACSGGQELLDLSKKLQFIPRPIQLRRSIDPISDIRAIKSLISVIKKDKIDTVVGHSPKGAMVAMIAAFLCGVKHRVYFRHGIFYETSKGLKHFLFKTIDRVSGSLADTVVCVSHDVKVFSEKDRLNSPHKNIILKKGTCNGVDALGRFNPENYTDVAISDLRKKLNISKENYVFGFVGRLVRDKGIEELITAWRLFLAKYSDAKLLLVGPLEERDSINEATKEFILNEETIVYTGYVPDTSLYYSLMNVFMLPTYREGFPTVVLEASSMRLPILLTPATGCREAIVEDETGKFITRNPHEIFDKMEFFYNNRQNAIDMGRLGREFVCKNFEQKLIWDEISLKLKI